MDIEVGWGGAGLMRLAGHDIGWLRWGWQTSDRARAGQRRWPAVLSHIIDVCRTTAGAVVVGDEDVRQTLRADRHLEEVTQRAIGGANGWAASQAGSADRSRVNDVVARRAHREDWLTRVPV